ncbi:tyrosine-type recombinase/integrase [Cytobacillus sp. IB215665]|uniref:tyrosine-type recombinase/integrase n=1 Tax=Cytobacillus sp. IB215665 TaxID=3097357 RepID=UPI002A136771|nr:tyrosine-type recombinase/integrase [Cytobacillus sp. IB215665]MDX8367138.1 tyrosine-type recombinase/integrase [Cytobacillus sp. IB215665]
MLVSSQENQLMLQDENRDTLHELIHKLSDTSFYPTLEKKIDLAEKENQNSCHDFSDYEMIYYYCHEQKNVDEKKNRSSGTRQEYLRELLTFATNMVKYASEIDVDIADVKDESLFKSLEPRHIKRYQDWMIHKAPALQGKEKYSAATIARKTSIIRSFLKFLYQNQYLNADLTTRLQSATVSVDERPNRDLGPTEALELLDFFKQEQHPILFGILHVLITTGIRNSELCSARVCDVHYDGTRGEYYLRIHGKGNKKRTVPLKKKVFESIVEFRSIRGFDTSLDSKDESPLFMTSGGKAYSNTYLSRYINKAVTRTELDFVINRPNPISPHTFRHCYAIISYHSGADIYKIMRSLGHEKIETTMIYLQKEFEKEDNAVHLWDQGLLAEYV